MCWLLGCIICRHVHESIKDCVSECAQVCFSRHRLNILPECPHLLSSSGLSIMPVLWVVPFCWQCICSPEMEETVQGDSSKESNQKLRHPNSFLCWPRTPFHFYPPVWIFSTYTGFDSSIERKRQLSFVVYLPVDGVQSRECHHLWVNVLTGNVPALFDSSLTVYISYSRLREVDF